jgi:fibronectin type 3 domain-containing protein
VVARFLTTRTGMISGLALLATQPLHAHPMSFNSTMSYSSSQPSGGTDSIANWTGAAFDAANVGGSGVNADGGADNGTANDTSTYVVDNGTAQGQTFTTGSNVNGYEFTSVTVRMAGYTNNTATGSNVTSWNLNPTNGPIIVTVGKISGTTHLPISQQNFMAGGTGHPGSGSSANGSGTYLTFTLPFPVHLDPNTTYSFDLTIARSANSFEMLGTNADPYASGAAFTRSGTTITPRSGDRVFQANLTASTAAPTLFTHPGALHTQADFDRMAAKVGASTQPWKGSYDLLLTSAYAQTGWPAYDIDWIIRGDTGNNYTRSQQDAQAIYQLALRWKLTGDTTYADRAVQIANVWSDLIGVGGNTNAALASGICGYLFATGGEILSTYSGWPAAEKQAYKDMMMRVFYTANVRFLWEHFGTPDSKGGNTHYRLNWDTDAMASMAAIGILCDNKAVYQQALDYFKNGTGNGRVERAAWYIHPDGTAQTEESGRDQPHNFGGWYSMGLLCQMAWNQGDDLFGYDNNRVLRAYEYNAKYNYGVDVPWVYHRNASLTYTETLSDAGRGLGGYPTYELVYNHYANVKGIAAPWSKLAMEVIRPEYVPGPGGHPSGQDCLGLGSLTYARDTTTTGTAPSGLMAQWSKNQVTLNWWGSVTATSYEIQRATSASGPYTTLGTATEPNLYFADATVANGTSYYYKVVAVTPSGNLESTPLLVNQALVARYDFEGTPNDAIGTRHGELKGITSPGYAAGFGGGQAISLNGTGNQYVQLPVGSGNYRDITLSSWVYWNGGNTWQRVFDFGSEIDKYMMLTVKNGAGKLSFQMTTSRATDGTLTIEGPVMPTATWTHVAITFNGDTATMYVNGLPVAAGSSAKVAPVFSQPFCYLGRSMWNADAYFNGRIDDFRIHNYALTGKEIYTLWGQGGSNVPPAFSANPMTFSSATEDSNYSAAGQTLAGTATDANGGALTYTKVSGSAWLTVASNGALSGTPSNADVGDNLFVVRVTDASGATDDANLRITVANTNDLPVWSITSITMPGVTRDQPYIGSTLAGLASDVDPSATLAYSKASGPAWLTIATDGTLTGTPGASDAGLNTFTIRVTDNTGATADATLAITVLPFELRASYAFEGTTDDSLGNHHGTPTGSPVYQTGRLGQGIVLDGSDDYVTLPAGVASHHDITVSTFVYWNGGANWQRVFDFGNDTSHYMQLTPNYGGGMRLAINNGAGEQQINTTALATGKWVHLAVTLSGDTGTLYVDGAVAATNTGMTLNPDDFKPVLNYLGKSQFTDALFNGRIDDFRVYNYALDAATIADIANPIPETPNGLTAAPRNHRIDLTWKAAHAANTYTVKRSTTAAGPYTVVASGITGTSFSDTGLVNGTPYYYVVSATNEKGESVDSTEISAAPSDLLVRLKFDETSGTTAADASGNGNTGTTVNSPTWVSGQFNNAINLTNTSSQYVTMPTGVVTGVTDFTVSTWVKMTSLATWARLFDIGTGTNNYMFLAPQGPTANRMRFAIRTATVGEQIINSSVNTPVGTWFHVAVTLTGTTGRLYINGVEAGSNTGMNLNPSSLGTTNLNYLGKSQWADPYLNGALDDFRIYGRAFSAAEITSLSTVLPAPSGLAATAGSGQVSLTWAAVSGAENYSVKRATTTGGPYTTVQSDLTSTSFTDTGLTNGTTYYYVVSASNLGGESPNSAETSATPLAPPAVPEGLAAIAGDATVALEWSAATGADSYQVKRATAPGGPYTTLASGVTGLTYNDSAVTNGTTYYYVISGVNAVAESANSAEVSAMPLPPVPAAPATLTATPGNSTVALVWSAADGADSYNVKRATNSGGPYATLASGLTATSYNDTSAVNETTYYYLVTATNLGGEGESSPEVSATPVTPPVAPAGLAATSGDASASLTWNSVAGASGYRLKRATTSGGPYALVTESTGTSFTDTGLTNGTTYYYVVSAYNAGGESANSSPVSAEPQAVPDAPTGLAATAASSSKINLAWNTVSGANSYAVKRATTTGGPYTTLATGLTATSFNDTGLTSATTYYYVVTATSNGGESVTSTEASATTSDLRVSLAFDETSGTTANDSAGDGYHATLVNGPVFATGTLGNAVDLDGANDHVTLPTGVLNGLTNFTISVWVKPDTVTNWSRVFDFGTGTTVNMFLTPKNAANGKVRFAITTGGGAGEQKIDGQTALTAGAWSHVVITWSGNTGILYVNGVEVGRNTAMTLNPSSLGTTSLNYLGRSQYPDPYFDGRIDDFRIYTRALGAAEVSAATAAQMPLASVSGLQATAASSGQINLSWTANPNATSYNVKRATAPGGPYTTLATGVTATNYSSSGLNAGATYYYVVSATNAGGEGSNSAETSATTFPAAPATLTAIAASSTQINLAWDASTGATSYTVKRSATSGGAYTTLATGVTATSYSDTGLTAGATWYYVVSASNTGESVDSTEASATTLAETPSGLAATVVSSSAIDLTWSATAGATGYDVKRSTSAGGPFDTIASGVTATAFSDSGLNAATTYHYVVAATNAAGASPDSASVNATTLPLPPATPSGLVATPGIAQVSLTWSTVSGATGYTVKRATVSGGPYTVVASDLASPAYTDTGLTNGTTYYYVVNATNTGGTSADSGEVSAVPSGLPSPWVTADIGTTGLAGSAEFANNAYTVTGAGSLGGTTDGFRYLYQPLSADGSIIARISTLEDTGSSARVGIMIRDTLAANSRMAALSVTGSGAYKWMRRTTTGGNVSNTNSSSGTAPNIWVRLVRVGNTITASKSTNGTSWTTIGSATVTMASSCYIGLAVSSGSTTTLNTSVFDNVTATP